MINSDSAVLIPILFLVGVPGNVLSAAVFRRQGLKERVNLCVFLLALADLVVITVTFLLTAEQVYRDLIGPAGFFITYCVGEGVMLKVCVCVCVYLCVCVFMCVCREGHVYAYETHCKRK